MGGGFGGGGEREPVDDIRERLHLHCGRIADMLSQLQKQLGLGTWPDYVGSVPN